MDTALVDSFECRYRNRLIGWLYAVPDVFLRYHKAEKWMGNNGTVIVWKPWGLK